MRRPGKPLSLLPLTYKPWQVAVVCLVLALSTLLTFQGVRHNGFLTYDDMDYVAQNRDVHQGVTIESIEWAFTTFRVSNWHPLTWISHMVDWSLYGNNPAGHHLTNLYLHTANAILLFLLLFYMTGFLGRSAMVAFLFALHPAHVESVAWLAERKDVLCAFFFLSHVACLCMESSQAFMEAVLTGHLRLCLCTDVKANGCYPSVYFALAGYLAVAQNFFRAECPR